MPKTKNNTKTKIKNASGKSISDRIDDISYEIDSLNANVQDGTISAVSISERLDYICDMLSTLSDSF